MNSIPTIPDSFVQETLARTQMEDAAGARAAATPLPGPLADAFSIVQGITVGKWTVRELYDIDFEFLAAIKHPMHQMMLDGIEGRTVNAPATIPRGPEMWALAWILTRDVDAVEAILKRKDGIESMNTEARKEFGRCKLGQLLALYNAVCEQLRKYWSVSIQYGSEGENGAPPAS